ncbi:MAG: hypothetical protein KF906_01790 [Actinobacteria bacterium]|nr:hypothetical protein [Actinomycetota bacterium]
MAERDLYLHELIDIVGQGQYDYMAHAGREPTNAMPDMLTLQGTFFVCAMGGGRWPQVVNIWDVGEQGWEGWAANVDRLNLKRRSAFYGDWWDEAAQWRSGGFDRLCGGVPGNPSTAEIAASGVKGTLFVHQLLSVRPGSALDYLAAVVAEQVPVWRDHGHEPTGIYEVLGNQHEVVVVWATSVGAQTRLRASRDAARGLGATSGVDADDRLVAWERTMAGFVTGGDTHLMTPMPGTVYGPADWDEASLDDWLSPRSDEGA